MDSLKNRKQFKFYRSYFDIISELENDTDKLNYLLSILEFQFNGIEIPLQGMAKFAFKSQKHSLDRQLKGFIDATLIDTPIATPIETPLWGADSIPIEHSHIGIINNKEEIINKEDKKNKEEKFESFRKQYLGNKRGLETEFTDFKKHKDWKECLELLLPAVEKQKLARYEKLKRGGFVPEWKNLKTWINQRCWEEEIKIEETNNSTEDNRLKLNDYPEGHVHKTYMQRYDEELEKVRLSKLEQPKIEENEF